MSVKHLHRHVTEFAERHNIRDRDTLNRMNLITSGFEGQHSTYSKFEKEHILYYCTE